QWSSQLARRDSTAIVLASRCLNTTQSLPFEPMRRLLGTVRCREQWARMADQLQPIWQAELLRLAPTLRAVAAPQGDQPPVLPTALSPNEERGLIAEALTQFVRAFQGNPLVLFLDDLHWADSATLDWLLYLTDRMANEPLLLVAACRPNEMSAHLVRLMAQWQREGLLERIDLPRFTANETTALLTALGTDATVIEYLHTQSGGNPYYLTQLSDVAVDGIPAPLADLVLARLRYLDEQWQPVLQAAAILEPAINLHLLSVTSGRTEEETLDALDGLLAAAILTEQGDEYEFTHPLVATVMRNSLSNGRRRLLHRRAAEGLVARHGTEEAEIAGQLTHHFAAAGEREQAAHFATVAGAAALRIGAANEAVAFYQQAMQLIPTAERQLGLGQALMLQPGQTDMARQAMEAALLTYERMEDNRGVIKAGLHLAASYLGTQDGTKVLHWARRVLPDIENLDDPTLHASAHYLMGTAQFRNGYSLSEAESHFRSAMALVVEGGLESEIALMSCFEWGNLCLERGEYATAVTRFRQAQELARQWQSIFFEVLSLNNLAYALLLAGKQTAAQKTIDQAFTLANQYAVQSAHYYLLSTHGEIALATGALAKADDAFQQAMALAEKYDNSIFIANLWAHRGRVAHAHGDLAVAHEQLARARQMVAPENALFLQIQINLWYAAVIIDQLDHVTASELLTTVCERLASTEYDQLQRSAGELQTRLLQLSD
ncbi:MAG: AAA family ATPase, partial [Caldilineaceae bacterium]|nr:AAA family ATPase [Caldilineaceae bacterium]